MKTMKHMTRKELEKALDLHMEDKAFGKFFIAAMLGITPDQVNIDALRNCMNAYAEAKWWEGYETGFAEAAEAEQIEHTDN